jgi:hypothetical protein
LRIGRATRDRNQEGPNAKLHRHRSSRHVDTYITSPDRVSRRQRAAGVISPAR